MHRLAKLYISREPGTPKEFWAADRRVEYSPVGIGALRILGPPAPEDEPRRTPPKLLVPVPAPPAYSVPWLEMLGTK